MNVGEKYLPQGDGVERMIDSGFTFLFFFAKCTTAIDFVLLLAGYFGSQHFPTF